MTTTQRIEITNTESTGYFGVLSSDRTAVTFFNTLSEATEVAGAKSPLLTTRTLVSRANGARALGDSVVAW